MKDDITECIQCNKPLGQESRDLGYTYCHVCRKCSHCSKDISAQESQWCYDTNRSLAVHSRCAGFAHPSKDAMTVDQTVIDHLNLIRLLLKPDYETSLDTQAQSIDHYVSGILVSQRSIDDLYIMLRNAQAYCAAISLVISRDRTRLDKEVGEREKVKQKKALEDRSKAHITVAERGIESTKEKFILNLMKNAFLSREDAQKVYDDAHTRKRADKMTHRIE